MLKFAIVERLCANLESERLVVGCVRTLWALEAISWKTGVEKVSGPKPRCGKIRLACTSAWTLPLAIDTAWS